MQTVIQNIIIITALSVIGLVSTSVNAAPKEEPAGFAMGIDKRTVQTNWYHYNSGGATTHETFDLIGVKGEAQIPLKLIDKMKLDFIVGATLFTGSYEGERGINTYEGDASGIEADAGVQLNYDAGEANLLGRLGVSVLHIGATAASDTAQAPYNEDFGVTIPEIYGAVGVNFDSFKAMGATSASIMLRFTLVDLGASTDYWINGEVESTGHSNTGIFFTVNFR